MSDRDENGRFLLGTSGNPNGRPPKDQSLTEILDRLGKDTEEIAGRTRREVLAAKLWEMAIAGDLSAIKYIFDRIDGSPRATLNASIRDTDPIHIAFEECPEFDGI